MKRTPWFERRFPALEDNGLLPGLLERLEGTPHRLRALLLGVEIPSEVAAGWSPAQELGPISNRSGCNALAISLRANQT
jgi:hypothetical protein